MEYTQNERIEIIKFIEENFGRIEKIYQDVGYDDLYLDVAQINPTKRKTILHSYHSWNGRT